MTSLRRPEPLDPNILLTQECLRDVMAEICGTKTLGTLVVSKIHNHSPAEVAEFLDDIGFGEYFDLPEIEPKPEKIVFGEPEVSARYHKSPMIVPDLVGNKKTVQIDGEESWAGEVNFSFSHIGYIGVGLTMVEHTVKVTGHSSDSSPLVSSTLDIRTQPGSKEASRLIIQVGEERPFDQDSIVAFCALALSLHAENAGL